jgi:hypothetical protein
MARESLTDHEAIPFLARCIAGMVLGEKDVPEAPGWALAHAEFLLKRMRREGIAIFRPQEGTPQKA